MKVSREKQEALPTKFYVILVAESEWIDKFTQFYMLCDVGMLISPRTKLPNHFDNSLAIPHTHHM